MILVLESILKRAVQGSAALRSEKGFPCTQNLEQETSHHRSGVLGRNLLKEIP